MATKTTGRRPQTPEDDDEQQKPSFGDYAPEIEDKDPDKLSQEESDAEFHRMVERGQLGEDPEAKKSLSPEDLDEAEKEAEEAKTPEISDDEAEISDSGDDSSLYNPEDTAGQGSKFGRLRALATKRNVGIGGGIGGVVGLLFFLMFSFATLEAVHVKEVMVGRSNSITNGVLEGRRERNFARTIRRMTSGDLKDKIKTDRQARRLRAQGFDVEVVDGKITKLEYKGHAYDLDPNTPSYEAQRKFFAGNADIDGRQIKRAFGDATGGNALTWRGKAARRVYGKIRTRLSNWTSRKETDEDSKRSQRERNAKNGRIVEKGDNTASPERIARATGTPTSAVAAPVDPTFRVGQQGDDSQLKEDGADNQANGEQARDTNFNDPVEVAGESKTKTTTSGGLGNDSYTGDKKGTTPELGSAVMEELPEGMDSKNWNPVFFGELSSRLAKNFPRFASRLQNLARGINVAEVPRTICRVKGTIRWIDNIKSVYMGIALARFATRYLSAADYQKAGLIKGEGLNLLMTWLKTASPVTGKTYTQAGGFQNVIMGDKDARPKKSHRTKYALARKQGFLGDVYNFADKFPLTSPNSCKTLNNGWVQVGGALVGLAAAVFSGGAVPAAQLASGFAWGLIQEGLWSFGESLALRLYSNTLIDFTENGELAGDALAAGWGALRGMNGGSNGLKPVTKAKAAQLALEAEEKHEWEMSQQSIFARYFDIHNADSFAANFAFALSTNANTQSVKTAAASGFNVLNPAKYAGSFFGVAKTFVPKAYAQAEESSSEDYNICNDEQIVRKTDDPNDDIEADIFCNIVMAEAPEVTDDRSFELFRNYVCDGGKCKGQKRPLIDDDGEPIDYPQEDKHNTPYTDLHDFIAACHSGRTNLLYKEKPNKDGSNDDKYDLCLENGNALPGDSSGLGRYQRYTDWYGYLTDEGNYIEDVNGEYTVEKEVKNSPECDPDDPPTYFCGDTTSGGGGGGGGGGTAGTGTQGASIVGDPYTDSSGVACAQGTNDLGIHEGWAEGRNYTIRLCSLPNLPSTGEESTPGTKYYVTGADGHALVNSRVSGAWLKLISDAVASGINNFGAGSSYRTMEHQQDIWDRNGHDSSVAARPGYSSHQAGVAIDFAGINKLGGESCASRAKEPSNPHWVWLYNNAHKYGFKQYAKESWHWDAYPAANRCGYP